MRFIAPTLGLLISLLLTACVSPVVIDRQSDANLANLQTYRFVSQDEDKPRELDDQRARSALTLSLADKGLRPDDSQPDVEVKHFFKRQQRFDGSTLQFGFGFTRNNVGLGASTPTEGEITEEYKLVVQLIDPQSNNVLWQATSRDELYDEMSSTRREAHIQRAVQDMFKRFP